MGEGRRSEVLSEALREKLTAAPVGRLGRRSPALAPPAESCGE